MVRILFFLIVLASISFAIAAIMETPGQVTIQWLGYEMRTHVVALLTALILLGFALFIVYQLLASLFNLPGRWVRHRDKTHMDKAFRSLTRGYAALAIGNGKKAYLAGEEANRLLSHHPDYQPIAQLLKAESARAMGNSRTARQQYETLLEYDHTEFTAMRGLLMTAEEEGKLDEAIRLAERTYKKRPKAYQVASTLLRLYKKARLWDKAELLLEQHSKQQAWYQFGGHKELDIDAEKAEIYTMRAHHYLYETDDKSDAAKAFDYAMRANKLDHALLAAAFMVAEAGLETGKQDEAAKIIEKSWKYLPNLKLGEYYIRLHADDSDDKRLKRVKKLYQLRPEHPDSHALLAEAALNAKDATLAEEHMQAALEKRVTKKYCELMVDIVELKDSFDTSTIQMWKTRADVAVPDPTWQCTNCQEITAHWMVECPNCGALETIEWKIPSQAANPVTMLQKKPKTKRIRAVSADKQD